MSNPEGDLCSVLYCAVAHSPSAVAVSEGPEQVLRHLNPAFRRLYPGAAEHRLGQPTTVSDLHRAIQESLVERGRADYTRHPATTLRPNRPPPEDAPIRFSLINTVTYPGADAGTEAEETADSEVIADLTEANQQLVITGLRAQELAERARRAEERLVRALVASRMVAWEWECAPDRVYLSETASEVFGLPPERTLSSYAELFDLVHPEDRERYRDAIATAPSRGGGYVCQFRVVRPADGVEIWMEDHGRVSRDVSGRVVAVNGVILDITSVKGAEKEYAQLLASEQRKSRQLMVATREAHHRIKNNLQSVTDLLSLELDQADAGTASVLHNCMDRIQAIAAIHDLLSHESEMESIEVAEALQRLVPMVLTGQNLAEESVTVTLHCDPARLPSRHATRFALILTELISNAVKHGLAHRQRGHLDISFATEEAGFRLTVQDDGLGLPPGFLLERDSNVGLQVVEALVSGMNGRLRLTNERGARAEVFLPHEGIVG
ncbi:MAG: sensor histidine kinase [Armatimonadota bacterium]